jgi:hypothetical protein
MCERRRLTAVGPRPLRVLKSGLWQVWQRDVRTQLFGLSGRPRSPSPATRCTTPQRGASKASPSLWHRKWRSSASVSRLSSGSAHAPNSVTAVHRSPRRRRSTRAPLTAPSSGCSNRRTARPRRSGPDGESDHRQCRRRAAPLRIVLGLAGTREHHRNSRAANRRFRGAEGFVGAGIALVSGGA